MLFVKSHSQLSKDGEQLGQMGMAATPTFKEGAHWTVRERKKFGGSDQKCFDDHAFYVSYNVTNASYSAKMEAMRGLQSWPKVVGTRTKSDILEKLHSIFSNSGESSRSRLPFPSPPPKQC